MKENFLAAYIACALWSSEEETGEMLQEDIAPALLDTMTKDCAAFEEKAGRLIGKGKERWTQAGHDFWLTRNGHGSGFWDRAEIWGEHAETLSEISRSFGECSLYIGDDGLIYS
jgi:hypothetical protein